MELVDRSGRTRITRALYAPVVLVAPASAAYALVCAWANYLTRPRWHFPPPHSSAGPPMVSLLDPGPPVFVSIVTLAGFVIPGALAWWRVVRGQGLIPEARLRERPVVSGVVALSSGLTVTLALFFVYVLADAWATAYQGDLGPLGGVGLLAMMTSAVALLVGECALIGFDKSSRRLDPIS